MKKRAFKIIFAFFILVLLVLFIYSSLSFSEDKTETMNWVGGEFFISEKSKLFGIILILSVPFYFILNKILFKKAKNHID